MTDDIYGDESQEDLNKLLVALSNAIEKIFNYAATSPDVTFEKPNTLKFIEIQVLAQLLANHIDLFPEDERDAAMAFAEEQQRLVYTLRSEHYGEAEPVEDDPNDPYGLAHMEPKGRA